MHHNDFAQFQIDGDFVGRENEVSRPKSALTDQIFKRRQIAAKLSLEASQRDDQLKKFRRSNFDDLGKVLRSLYVFESRLRKEQQQIRRQLGERDAVIRQQQVEIAKLRQSLARFCGSHNDDAPAVTAPAQPVVTVDCKGAADAQLTSSRPPDLITSISPRPQCERSSKNGDDRIDHHPPVVILPLKPATPDQGTPTTRKYNGAPPTPPGVADTGSPPRSKSNPTVANNNINFNKNVYHSKTVTDLSLNDISSFPNPTPNNNLFVVSNSIFSKNEFAYDEVSKEINTSVKQNGKVITSALKKADKYPSPKTVHFGKTTHIPEPDEDSQTDIVKTVETLLLQCGDSCTESENDTSSTASTETSPSVSQMVRKFESICTTTNPTDTKGSPTSSPNLNGSYIAEAELKTAAARELDTGPDSESDSVNVNTSLGDLDPRNNFEEFRFEDSDLDKEYRPEADGLECPCRPVSSGLSSAEDSGDGRVNYESFLEVTGLSQKSIITMPFQSNRNIYGSHRNVQKPKDVKSRNRAKSTSFEYKTYPSAIKYWTEPYL